MVLQIVDQMPENTGFYFACLKIEGAKAHRTLNVNAYFQYSPSNNVGIHNYHLEFSSDSKQVQGYNQRRENVLTVLKNPLNLPVLLLHLLA